MSDVDICTLSVTHSLLGDLVDLAERFYTEERTPKMAFSFQDKKFLVTGACSGLGKQIAISLHDAGAKVYALSNRIEGLDELKREYPSITIVHQDLANWNETKSRIEELGPMDGLVNNAGLIPDAMKAALDFDEAELDKYIRVNLLSAINCIQVVSKKMIEAGIRGSIVNISSIASHCAFRGCFAYNVSKAGLDMVTKQFALELAINKIRVNSINPTLFMSDSMKNLVSTLSGVEVQAFMSRTPMGRLPEMSEIVGPVLYLLSDHSAMVTGTTHIVDGGNLSSLSP